MRRSILWGLVCVFLNLGVGWAESSEVRSLLPGTYAVSYWDLGKGTVGPPGHETMTIRAQGDVFAVTWEGDGRKIDGIGILHQAAGGSASFAVGYYEDGQAGVIVYDVVVDAHTVRLAAGEWTAGMQATQIGQEVAERHR